MRVAQHGGNSRVQAPKGTARAAVCFFNYHYYHYYYYAGEQTGQGRCKGKNKGIQNRGRDSAVAKTCVSFHSMKFIRFDRGVFLLL